MAFDLSPWHSAVYIIGEATVIFVLGAILVSFVLVIISLYSIRKGRLYCPGSSRQVSFFLKDS